jgi:glycerol-3-phosphate dehydrogenase
VYAGLRPLLPGESEPTSRISREHTVVTPVPGPGDDRRRQAHDVPRDGRDAVDAAAHSLRPRDDGARLDHRPGAAGGRGRLRGPHQPAGAAGRRSGCTSRGSTTCSGGTADLVDECSPGRQRPELAEPLEGADDYLAAEVVYAVTHEGARTSTTCSPAGRGSRSRRSTGASRPHRDRPADGRRARAGTGRRRMPRSIHYLRRGRGGAAEPGAS